MNKLDRLLAWVHLELQAAKKATVNDYRHDGGVREAYWDGRCETLEDVIEQIQGLKENP